MVYNRVQNCQRPVAQAQEYMQKELEDFMVRLKFINWVGWGGSGVGPRMHTVPSLVIETSMEGVPVTMVTQAERIQRIYGKIEDSKPRWGWGWG